ncbi:hypothetical protein CT0861_01364 [Colletotrichum tofieldiae]|uniref:Tat pathway signal sequence n=1 Tax=Colletotrichum tofieldiae TaxID=708197 RepID=A0A161WGY6_9PEZI|nr:hypothetical protein CT0861_01364 [Colletotrichum tofieldiae]
MASIICKLNPFQSKRGEYSAVHQDELSCSPTYRDDEQQITDSSVPSKVHETEWAALEKRVRLLRAAVAILLIAIVTTLVLFVLYVQGSNRPARYLQLEWSGLLGEDSNGFVPNGKPHAMMRIFTCGNSTEMRNKGIGQPLRPTYFGPDHPYYLPEDTYYDFNKSIAYVKKMKAMHNCKLFIEWREASGISVDLFAASSVLVNRKYAKRIHPDGNVSGLNPFFTWKEHAEGRQVYTLRGFHHMHCLVSYTTPIYMRSVAIHRCIWLRGNGIAVRLETNTTISPSQIVIAEEFAYRIHNQSKWTEPHIAHCVNTLRDAIQCLADAQPLSFVNGYGVGQITDDQAVMCRDWSALRAWGNDRVRGLRIIDNAPVGVSWENVTEILPYPELTEMELRGLA